MKKIVICISTIIGSISTHAQLTTILELQSSQPVETFSSKEIRHTYFGNLYLSYLGKKGFGFMVSPIAYPDGVDITISPLWGKDDSVRKVYTEMSLGPGISMSDEGKYYYGETHFYLENKSDRKRASGKLILFINPAYTPKINEWWVQSYMTIGITRLFQVGAHFQTDAAKGIRIGITPCDRFQLYAAGWKQGTFGLIFHLVN